MKKSKLRDITTDTNGVVGIVATVLVIGLIISFVGIVKTVNVPVWLEQKEAKHMSEVETQFTQLKYTLDLVALLGQNTAISNYITLGSEEMPFFNNGRTYDMLAISSDAFLINFSNQTDLFSFSMSDIQFLSNNQYFVNQILCIEAGALIMDQTSDSILLGQPIVAITNFTNVTLTLYNFSGLTGKAFVSGYGTYVLSNQFIRRTTYSMKKITDIEIITAYPEAWADFFNSSAFLHSGLTYSITTLDDAVYIVFSDTVGNFDIEVIDIRSQLAIWR